MRWEECWKADKLFWRLLQQSWWEMMTQLRQWNPESSLGWEVLKIRRRGIRRLWGFSRGTWVASLTGNAGERGICWAPFQLISAPWKEEQALHFGSCVPKVIFLFPVPCPASPRCDSRSRSGIRVKMACGCLVPTCEVKTDCCGACKHRVGRGATLDKAWGPGSALGLTKMGTPVRIPPASPQLQMFFLLSCSSLSRFHRV